MALLLIACCFAPATGARADELVLPPEPDERPPRRSIEIDLGLTAPLFSGSLCPSGHRCLVGGGASFGVLVERRRPRGFSLGIGYELALLDGHTVYEISTTQELFVAFRHFFLPREALHPFVSSGGGVVVLGDTFRIDTVGVNGHLDVGLEAELSETVACTFGLGLRMGWFLPFSTEVDNARRSRGGEPTLLVLARVGLVLITGPR